MVISSKDNKIQAVIGYYGCKWIKGCLKSIPMRYTIKVYGSGIHLRNVLRKWLSK